MTTKLKIRSPFHYSLWSTLLTLNTSSAQSVVIKDIEVPSLREIAQSAHPQFQESERDFQRWNQLSALEKQKTEGPTADVANAFLLKQQFFKVENPKQTFQNLFKSLEQKSQETTPSKFDRLGDRFERFSILGIGVMTTLAIMPESFTHWNRAELASDRVLQTYVSKVSQGPVDDNDSWAVNWIGHPISGAMYYLLARHSGFNWIESTAFSILMSTFFWEYGLEGTIEVPSKLDLVVTPLVGSLFGEAFYSAEKAIMKNEGKILGSKVLGTTAKILMNPAGLLMDAMVSQKPVGMPGYYKVGYFAESRRFGIPLSGVQNPIVPYVGIRLKIWF